MSIKMNIIDWIYEICWILSLEMLFGVNNQQIGNLPALENARLIEMHRNNGEIIHTCISKGITTMFYLICNNTGHFCHWLYYDIFLSKFEAKISQKSLSERNGNNYLSWKSDLYRIYILDEWYRMELLIAHIIQKHK